MEEIEYLTMSAQQEANWWYVGRKRIVESVIKYFIKEKIKIADVACGSGVHLELLKKFGEVVGLEQNDFCLGKIKENYGGTVRTIQWTLPDPVAEKFDLLVLTDVMEHLPDDKLAVQWMAKHVTEKGKVLITVPAHEFLWSEMDDSVHHYRRYSRNGLMEVMGKEFDILYCSYYNVFLFPVKVFFIFFSKAAHKIMKPKQKRSFNDVALGPINFLFEKILVFESYLIPRVRLPFGVALVMMAQKKK